MPTPETMSCDLNSEGIEQLMCNVGAHIASDYPACNAHHLLLRGLRDRTEQPSNKARNNALLGADRLLALH